MVYKTHDVETSLEKKGFQRKNGDHKFFSYHTLDGIKTKIWTMTSHGHKEISPPIFGQMTKQCRLTRKQFVDLIECPLSQEDYERILSEQGFV